MYSVRIVLLSVLQLSRNFSHVERMIVGLVFGTKIVNFVGVYIFGRKTGMDIVIEKRANGEYPI